MKNWFNLNKSRIILGLSYDGTDFMQDINRSGSSKFIDKKFFLETYPKQSVKMTISKKNCRQYCRWNYFFAKSRIYC